MMFEHNSRHKKTLIVIAALLLVLGVGVFIVLRRHEPEPYPRPTDDSIPKQATLTGESVCLPHKDSSGPQTLECAIGIKADSGLYYALDVQGKFDSGYYFDAPTGTRIKVSGSLVPIEAISSDQWQKYNIKGIMHVEAYEKLEK